MHPNTSHTTDIALMILTITITITPIIFINTLGIHTAILTLTLGSLTGFAYLNKHGNSGSTAHSR